jgi:membrane-bound serine protease (ClpP class)
MVKYLSSPQGRRLRLSLAAFALTLAAVSFSCAGSIGAAPGSVHVLTTDGVVNPVMERYLDRGISAAEDDQAAAVVIRIDTPGGLVTSMDDIVKRILDSDVPVVVYVWPSGGQAASAGTYITYASHVAAMAPGTVIGAATPVAATGGDIEGDMRNKVIENAVAKIRGLADIHGRNADWAEDAVRHGTSAQARDALELNVVEHVADDLPALLAAIHGTEVNLPRGQQVTLETADAPVVFNDRNFFERFLGIIADPNIAFLLISLGSLAIFIEIINPGQIFPGVFGVIALLVGFFALSVIPFNWAGVALIMFAFLLFGLELFVSSGGILGAGGVVALILGGILLTSGNPPEFRVREEVVIGLAVVLGGMVLFVLVNVFRIRRLPPQVGIETIIGRRGLVRSALAPSGYVFVDGENWTAELDEGTAEPGDSVVVTAVEGLKLKVKKPQPQQQEQGGN